MNSKLKKILFRRRSIWILLILILIIWYLLSLPKPLFHDPTSTVLIDRNKILLGAHIADDEQWRFPYNDSVPEKFKQSIIQFEDRQFYRHPGFNPFAFSRALFQNIKSKLYSI